MGNRPTPFCTKPSVVVVPLGLSPLDQSPPLGSLRFILTNPTPPFPPPSCNSFSIPLGSISSSAGDARSSPPKKKLAVAIWKKRPRNWTTLSSSIEPVWKTFRPGTPVVSSASLPRTHCLLPQPGERQELSSWPTWFAAPFKH